MRRQALVYVFRASESSGAPVVSATATAAEPLCEKAAQLYCPSELKQGHRTHKFRRFGLNVCMIDWHHEGEVNDPAE